LDHRADNKCNPVTLKQGVLKKDWRITVLHRMIFLLCYSNSSRSEKKNSNIPLHYYKAEIK
jgi:hypothetical protein